MDTKIIYKVLSNENQTDIKGNYIMTRWKFSQECKIGSITKVNKVIHHIHRIKET